MESLESRFWSKVDVRGPDDGHMQVAAVVEPNRVVAGKGDLIARCYASLRRELGCIPMRCPAYRRVYSALTRLEERASHRRVHVERNAEPLPLDLSWVAPW